MNEDTGGLSGSWTHSFEEDDGEVQVYRPSASFAFPPARRGRETLEFGDGGKVVSGTPGPDDRLRTTSRVMTALGMNRFRLDGEGTPGQVLEIVESGPDVLKVRYV